MESSLTTTTSDLPLDWTRVSRNPCCSPGTTSGSGVCPHRLRRRQRTLLQGAGSAITTATTSSTTTTTTVQRRRPTTTYHGQVIACLLDGNPDWFQAYFFLEDSQGQEEQQQVWGLLGIQKEIDECLQCSEGGYRVIDLKITSTGNNNNTHTKNTMTFADVEWTGGDMMDLKGDGIQMQATKILTSSAALPVLEQVFSALTRRVREESDDCTTTIDMLEVFPELTIVVGRMQLEIPDE